MTCAAMSPLRTDAEIDMYYSCRSGLLHARHLSSQQNVFRVCLSAVIRQRSMASLSASVCAPAHFQEKQFTGEACPRTLYSLASQQLLSKSCLCRPVICATARHVPLLQYLFARQGSDTLPASSRGLQAPRRHTLSTFITGLGEECGHTCSAAWVSTVGPWQTSSSFSMTISSASVPRYSPSPPLQSGKRCSHDSQLWTARQRVPPRRAPRPPASS